MLGCSCRAGDSDRYGFSVADAVPAIPGIEHEDEPLPPDYTNKAEWVFARLMYPAIPAYGFRGNPDWKHGNANWTIDYPVSDRHLSAEIRRLTRIDARSVEQPIDLDDDDVFNYPFLYAVEVGYWNLTHDQISKFREYLLRGGFFMCDDFHGTQEWAALYGGDEQSFSTPAIVGYSGRRSDIPCDFRSG